MARVTVTCGNCQGAGRIELRGVFRQTLAQVPFVAWSTTGAIHDRIGPIIARTALIERLNTLAAHGLVERRKAETARGLEWRRVRENERVKRLRDEQRTLNGWKRSLRP